MKRQKIRTYCQNRIGLIHHQTYNALLHGKKGKVEEFINGQLLGSISYFDSEEKFYHGYMMGVLAGLGGRRMQRCAGIWDLLLQEELYGEVRALMDVWKLLVRGSFSCDFILVFLICFDFNMKKKLDNLSQAILEKNSG